MRPEQDIFFITAYVLMLLGLAGTFLPMLPSAPLVWLGALIWAWADGFQRVGWPTLLFLGLLAIVALILQHLLTTVIGRRMGVSWKAIVGAFVGGLLGGAILSILPVVGTLSGALLGAVGAMLALEYYDKRDWPRAWRAVAGYVVSFLASSVTQVLICLLMIVIFSWQAFY